MRDRESVPRGLRIAISPCPNDIFVFGKWMDGEVHASGLRPSFEFLDIDQLNRRGLEEDPPEVLKFSFAHYASLRERYRLCEVGAALGHGVGPLVIARGTAGLESRKGVIVPGLETTACRLLRRYGPAGIRLRKERYDRIMPLLQSEDDWAGLIIHESRFTYLEQGFFLLMDLGQQWEKEFNLPLPLGGVGILRSLPSLEVEEIEGAMRRSLEAARANPLALMPLMQMYAREMDPRVIMAHVGLYVNEYTLELGGVGHEAVERLLGVGPE
ncbi:MAG: 1,4-dihydroxy-6-naphthoate synthase [Planctomycetes bacterium]|nr:1,4-dihydroxy-6-naphthoate synthase [Planctomycetota bacterium]